MCRPELAGLLAIAVLGWGSLACDSVRAPTSPPRCEPPGELELERGLKRGYRALVEGRSQEATDHFRAVIGVEEHPEARAGLRAVGKAKRRASLNRQSPTSAGRIWLSGRDVPVNFEVDFQTLRYEEELARQALGARLKIDPTPTAAERVGFSEREAPESTRIDLVVLHASGGLSAREHLLRTRLGTTATHFLVDWDGRIFQTLDLGLQAHHTADPSLNDRSISITLVNPMKTDSQPLPDGATGSEHLRPLPAPAHVHGELVQTWGYTAGQERSLARLLLALSGTFTKLPRQTPLAMEVLSREDQVGVVGMLHLDATALDPGPGLDWNSIRRTLQSR